MGVTTCGEKRGTPAGHKRHWRAKEPACEDCIHAHNRARADSKARARAALEGRTVAKMLARRAEAEAEIRALPPLGERP